MNSLQVDFKAALGDVEFDDVVLISSDGEHIPANRLILSLRSNVFRQALLNKESITRATAKIDYSSAVVKSLVHFCYTDELIMGRRDGANFCQDESIALVGLLNASEFFGMNELKRHIFPVLSRLVARYQFAATTVVCCASDDDNAEASMLMELAQRVIALRPSSALTPETLRDAKPSRISKLINGLIAEGYEEMCITLLEEWAAGSEERLSAARRVVASIKLERLDPRILGEFVDRGTVVTPEVAFPVFRQQAEAWANGATFSRKSSGEKQRDVVIVHGCGNPEVNGVYVYQPAGAVNMYYKQRSGEEKPSDFTLEEDETDKTWYLKRGESDLLFKAPFERDHDFTKVPFDTWEAEDEEENCTPPYILFVPVASA